MLVKMIIKWTFLICLVFVDSVLSNMTSSCGHRDVTISYMDMAMDMITKAKHSIPHQSSCHSKSEKPMDCADVYKMGHNKSRVYTIWPVNRIVQRQSLDVYCDMDTNGGGWTLIQRRGDFGRPKDYFFKDWKSYKDGFGNIETDFWLGNDNIFALTNQKLYSVRFDLKDVAQNTKYALYDNFWIDDGNNKYTLHISDYSGDAGDSMISEHNNRKFSTKDQDNDDYNNTNCALVYKGGWWYNSCYHSNLNGLYLKGKHESYDDGVKWTTFKGYNESFESIEIKIRPKNFRSSTLSKPS